MATDTTPATAGVISAARPRRTVHVGLWVAQVLLAAQFASGGTMKIAGHSSMTAMFDAIGAGDWFRFLVGGLEVAGAIGLLVPRLAGPAALGLVGVLLGASITNTAVLHISPAFPLVLLVIAAAVAYGRRDSTRRLAVRLARRSH